MLKEKFDNAKEFVKEHKVEIIAGTIGIAAIAVLGYKLNKANESAGHLKKEINKSKGMTDYLLRENLDLGLKIDEISEVAHNSLQRETERIDFEIAELKNSIDRLDGKSKINKFHRIPERKARIAELEIDREMIQKEILRLV